MPNGNGNMELLSFHILKLGVMTVPFGAHETMEVHEILNEKINMMNHFSLYRQECQNPALCQMIDRQMQTIMQAYDQLLNYTHDYNAAQMPTPQYAAPKIQPQQIQYGLNSPQPHAPQTGRGLFEDQHICFALISCHKNSAKNHMTAALECADPNVREMLNQGALVCSNQAYEVFLFMNENGYYQVPTMQDHTAKTFLHTYQPTSMNVPQ